MPLLFSTVPLDKVIAARGILGCVAQADTQIAEKDRCSACKGAGWTWWSPEADLEGRWIVCRECIGTGRSDQKGRKRHRPEDPASG